MVAKAGAQSGGQKDPSVRTGIRNSISKVPPYKNQAVPVRHLHNPLSGQRVRTTELESELGTNHNHHRKDEEHRRLSDSRPCGAVRRPLGAHRRSPGASNRHPTGPGHVPRLPQGPDWHTQFN